MDDFKLNAAKMIAAQQKRNNNRARSPESDSNWDSSEPEDTLPNVSSEEEVSVVSTSRKGKDKLHTPNAPKPEARSHTQVHKPASSNRLAVKSDQITKASPASSIRSGQVSKAGVNVFVDRGSIDSSDEDISVASRKSIPPKEEQPPYDFRKALEETPRNRNENRTSSESRPGKSRKGNMYDPSPDMLRHSSVSEKKQLAPTPPEDDKSKKKKWKVNLGFQPDGNDQSPVIPHGSNNLEMSLQKNLTNTMTTTSSEIERPKMEESMMGRLMVEKPIESMMYDEPRMAESSHLLVEENTHRYIYHYQHGNVRYYDTRPNRQDVYMTAIADKSEKLVRRGVQEVFAALRIIVDFFLIFILELLRFLAYNVFGLLFVGLLTTFGDYFFKPVLAAFFNSILQPLAVFLYNIGAVLRTLSGPFIDILRGIFTQIAMLLRAFRLVEINWREKLRDNQRDVENV